jgi:hypothetical protein
MTDAATLAPKEREEKQRKVLLKDFVMAEYAYGHFSVTLPVGWKFDDTLKPEFWANVAHILDRPQGTNDPVKTGTIIDIRTEDHAFFGQLYVRAVRKQALDVAVLREPVYFGPQGDISDDGFDVRWNVGAKGFDIVRKGDGAIVGKASDFKKKEDAVAWIARMKG